MNRLGEKEFRDICEFIFRTAGISLSPAKKALVEGRLAKRVQLCEGGYSAYLKLLKSPQGAAEAQSAIDLLTTNETYFFREPRHFEFLKQVAMEAKTDRQPFRVWSAASSSGEEAYSIAMVLADVLTARPWEVFGSDISTRVLARARTGHYPMERAACIPPEYLQRFCLRGRGTEEGTLLIENGLRKRVEFAQVNLNAPLPSMPSFDVIFLRNVMIYFSNDTKREVVTRLLLALKPGGHFIIGHSESLHGIIDTLEVVAPSVYRKAW